MKSGNESKSEDPKEGNPNDSAPSEPASGEKAQAQSTSDQSGKGAVTESSWQVAQLAATLLKPSDVRSTISRWLWSDEYFQDRAKIAVHQARVLLDLSGTPPTLKTSLYQWFEPGEKMGPTGIGTRIEELGGWRASASIGTVTTRLNEIEDRWIKRILDFEKHSPNQFHSAVEAQTRIKEFLEELKETPGIEAIRPTLEKESCKFLDSLISPDIFATDEERGLALGSRERRVFEWCFGREPKAREAGMKKSPKDPSQSAKDGDRSYKEIRPHEVFRYAEEKDLLPEKLLPQLLASLPTEVHNEWISRQVSPQKSFEIFNKEWEKDLFSCYPWGG